MLNFVIMHQSVVAHDAIGQDISQMYQLLSPRHTCYVHCEYTDIADLHPIDTDKAAILSQDLATVIIYHHSNYWAGGESILRDARCRIVFRYHNITPPHFFREVPLYSTLCIKGREQTLRLARMFPSSLWMSDSLFNLAEIGLQGLERTVVIPPFPDCARHPQTAPAPETLRRLIEDDRLNVFFIGRFAPNKGHILLAKVLTAYKKHVGVDIRLSVFGKLDPRCQPYFDSFMEELHRGGVQELLNWEGCISDEERLAYYLGADAYLCCSEHEGFCVPIVEAQAVKLPVVARSTSAVPETLGPGQLLLGDDPVEYANVLRRIAIDARYRQTIVQSGYCNYMRRFQHSVVCQMFLAAMRKLVGQEI